MAIISVLGNDKTLHQIGGGVTDEVKEEINTLQTSIDSIQSVANNALPKSNITRSTSVTISGNNVVDAIELNPNINGSLRNLINNNLTRISELQLLGYYESIISENDNLDNYITPGVYICPSTYNSGTLINKPVSLNEAFRMQVFYPILSTYYIAQSITLYNNGTRYYRCRDGYNSNKWNSWYKIASVVDT